MPSKATQPGAAMAAPKPKQHNKEENGVPASDSNGSSADIIALVSSSEIFQQLLKVDVDNKRLRERNAALEVTNNTNMDTISEKRDAWTAEKAALERALQSEQNEIKTLREAKDKADGLSKQIKQQEAQMLTQVETIKKKGVEISRHQALCEKAKEELDREKASAKVVSDSLRSTQQELARSKKELDIANEDLTEVRSFIAPLQPLASKVAQIQDALANIFRQFLEFFLAEMSSDAKVCMPAAGAMEDQYFPLPASNSTAAKQMRVAAALSVCGNVLTNQVFRQPLVNLELDRALEAMAVENPDHEAYVRAVLLKLHKVFPDEQKLVQEDNVEHAVEEMTAAVAQLMPRATGLASKLKPLCEAAAEAWNLTLEVENKIDAQFRFRMPEYWRAVPLAEPDKKQPPATTTTTASQNGKPPANPPKQPPLSKADVVRVVWPAFTAHVPDAEGPVDFELVSCGYVLQKAQIKEAEEEVAHEESACRHSRQDSRRQVPKKRRNSVAPASSARGVSIASNGG